MDINDLDSDINSERRENFKKDANDKLKYIVGLEISFMISTISFSILLQCNFLPYLALIPLEFQKILSIIKYAKILCKGNDNNLQENLKEIIESALMLLYYVTSHLNIGWNYA